MVCHSIRGGATGRGRRRGGGQEKENGGDEDEDEVEEEGSAAFEGGCLLLACLLRNLREWEQTNQLRERVQPWTETATLLDCLGL